MKISTLIFGICIGFLLMVFIPFILIQLNNKYSLPSFNLLLFKTVGLIFIIIGSVIFIYCSKIFKLLGNGTPVPIEPPKKIVIAKFYQYVRNPIYLGYFLILFGEYFFFGTITLFFYSIIFIIITHLYVVYVEEPKLIRKFGNVYIQYTKSVPRWIPLRH